MKSVVRNILMGLLLTIVCHRSSAQSLEAQQLLLNVEKLAQLKQMLSDLKKGYQILYKGYNTIKNISEGSFNIHDAFLNHLLEISPAVRNYKKIGQIVSFQIALVKEYKEAFSRFRQSDQLTPEEVDYLGKVYANLFDGSVKNIEALATVLMPRKLRMSDEERLKAIDDIYADMEDKITFLRHFNNKTKVLTLQRLKEARDIQTIRSLYGINKK